MDRVERHPRRRPRASAQSIRAIHPWMSVELPASRLTNRQSSETSALPATASSSTSKSSSPVPTVSDTTRREHAHRNGSGLEHLELHVRIGRKQRAGYRRRPSVRSSKPVTPGKPTQRVERRASHEKRDGAGVDRDSVVAYDRRDARPLDADDADACLEQVLRGVLTRNVREEGHAEPANRAVGPPFEHARLHGALHAVAAASRTSNGSTSAAGANGTPPRAQLRRTRATPISSRTRSTDLFEGRHPAQPLIAPSVRPRVIRSCATPNTTSTGTIASTRPANSCVHCALYSALIDSRYKPERQRELALVGEEDESEEELVPDRQRVEQGDAGEARAGKREHHARRRS